MQTMAAGDTTATLSLTRSPLLRTFHWFGSEPAHHVTVSGDFNHWSPSVLTRHYDNEWCYEHTFKPTERGVYMYKYQLGGKWQHDPRFLTCKDEHGNVNNVVEVLGPAIHEHDTFQTVTEPSEVYPNMANDDNIFVICDACQTENHITFHHCTTCHTFDYCPSCYTSRTRRSRAFARNTNPAALASWVVATRAIIFWETHPPMQRDPDDLHHYIAFTKTLDGILKKNGHTSIVFECCKTEKDVFQAIYVFFKSYTLLGKI